ncbi:MAG: dihydropteroate synthase-like protein [Sulfolobales archaeon]
MKILIVTAKIPEKLIREIVASYMKSKNNINLSIDVVSSEKPVAALMNKFDLESILEKFKQDLGQYDLVITPGLLVGDIAEVCSRYGVKCFKGTRFAGDLPKVLDAILKGIELSTKEPADRFIEELYTDLSREKEIVFSNYPEAFRLKDLVIPTRSPPLLIAAEIVISGDLKRDLLRLKRISYYSDIIVIGTDVDSDKPDYIRSLINELSVETRKVLAIDSLNIREIRSAVEGGVSLIMNLSRTFEKWLDDLGPLKKDLGYVVVPDYVGGGTAEERARYCVQEYEYFRSRGLEKIILDPVAPPPLFGSLEALYAISILKRELSHVPVLLGAANIYELIDADPAGSIALLTAFGVESGASIILVTEESWKTRGSVDYVKRSVDMVHRAFIKRSPPIDVGVDLFIAKSKKKGDYIEIAYNEDVLVQKYIPPKKLDRDKFFVIQVDYDNELIEVYIFSGNKEKALYRVRGRDPRSLGRKVLELSGVDDPEHAFYLGIELARAYEALRTGRAYIQDYVEDNHRSFD